MSDKVAIAINNVHKSFELASEKRGSVKEIFVNFGKRQKKKRQQVLKGVTFEINEGDFFGIVGRNGSGKSTLLKILAGVYEPTKGSVAINGSLTPFIELGVGFNPELSGRDNVYLNGAILGFSRKETALIYDDIVDFAELHDAMDKKLKNYSSGMQVRLAFSIAVKAKKDILIFDEVLAVGDEAFQAKCIRIFEEYKANKQTVVLVTHDMETVKRFCNKAVLIHDGIILEEGSPSKVAKLYSDINDKEINQSIEGMVKRESRIDVKTSKTSYEPGEPIRVDVNWKNLEEIISVGVNIFKVSGEHVTGVNTKNDETELFNAKNGKISLLVNTRLNKGEYKLLVEAFKAVGKVEDYNDEIHFRVSTREPVLWSGMIDVDHTWLK